MKYLEARFCQFEVVAGRADSNPAAANSAAGPCMAFSIHWLRLALSNSRELPRDRLAKKGQPFFPGREIYGYSALSFFFPAEKFVDILLNLACLILFLQNTRSLKELYINIGGYCYVMPWHYQCAEKYGFPD